MGVDAVTEKIRNKHDKSPQKIDSEDRKSGKEVTEKTHMVNYSVQSSVFVLLYGVLGLLVGRALDL